MNEARVGDPLADISVVLWLLAVLVAVVSAHVAIGYARQSRRAVDRRTRIICGAAAAATLGTGAWSAMLLGLSSQDLRYSLGFLAFGLAGAWVAIVAAIVIGGGPLLRWRRPWLLAVAGALIGAGSVACELLLVRAAGVLPGVVWQWPTLGLAALVPAVGAGVGLWMVFVREGRARNRDGWRWGAAAVIGLTLIAGQELAMSAASLGTQRSSAYERQVPALAVCVFAGIGMPITLLLLQMDLHLRRVTRDGGEPLAPRRRRRSRRKHTVF